MKQVLWEYIAITAVDFMPAALYWFFMQCLAGDMPCRLLRQLRKLHIIYAVGAIVGVAANIMTMKTAMDYFYTITAATGLGAAWILFRSFNQKNRAAKLIALSFASFIVFLAGQALVMLLGGEWPLVYSDHWGLCLLLTVFLLIIRVKIGEDSENSRKISARTWRTLSVKQAPIVENHPEELIEEPVTKVQIGSINEQKQLTLTQDTIARFAHEINSPLGTGIMAASHLGQEVEELSLKFKDGNIKKSDLERHLTLYSESADIILANFKSAADIVKAFRNAAAGDLAEQKKMFNVKQHIEQVIASLRPRVRLAGHNLELSCDRDFIVYSLQQSLTQVLTNLINNAVIHGYGQGKQGVITLNAYREDKMAVIEVADDGKGIAEGAIDRIFEPYYTTNREFGSTGLGLSIVKDIVTDKLGGTIKCYSIEGKGSIFTIRFPVREG